VGLNYNRFNHLWPNGNSSIQIWASGKQAHNQGECRGENSSIPLEKCVGYSLKISDIVQKIWDPLRKLFAPPGAPSWLRAWWNIYVQFWVTSNSFIQF